jgi:hypothetical protein
VNRPETGTHISNARERLLHVLAGVTHGAAESARERCPYRDRHDACTFGYGCRNQLHPQGSPPRCAGGTLQSAEP